MQTVTNKVVLHESEGLAGRLPGGDTLERVVHHEIKELGQHVLACTVTYRLPPNARSVPGASEDAADPSLQTFRKFYKFAVGSAWFRSCFETKRRFLLGNQSSVSENKSSHSQGTFCAALSS
jgi:hypothetical protein